MTWNNATTNKAATFGRPADRTIAGLAHDARNLLSAVHLYCELLATPGVLAPRFRHYARDLRRIGETGVRLNERLIEALAGAPPALPAELPAPAMAISSRHSPAGIRDLAAELLDLKELLAAVAGAAVRLEIECAPCAGELGLSSEDLFRVLFNLVSNSVEALRQQAESSPARPFRADGFIRITAQRGGAASFLAPPGDAPGPVETVVLCVRDNGPGIAADRLPCLFERGDSTRPGLGENNGRQVGRAEGLPSPGNGLRNGLGPALGRGLGLSIVRQLIEDAGGAIRAVSSPGLGCRFDIELPLLHSSVEQGPSASVGAVPGRPIAAEPIPVEPATESGQRGANGPAPHPDGDRRTLVQKRHLDNQLVCPPAEPNWNKNSAPKKKYLPFDQKGA